MTVARAGSDEHPEARRVRTRRCGILLALLLLAGCSGSSSGSEGATNTTTAKSSTTCAWNVRADRETMNIAYPDTAATYWTMSYALAPDEHLELAGQFPDARYASFITYGPIGGPIDSLTDDEIEPDAGATNPFRPSDGDGTTDATGDSYTVQVRSDQQPTDETNQIGAVPPDDFEAPATTEPTEGEEPATRMRLGSGGDDAVEGTVIYRVYLPRDDADPTGGAGLPAVTIVKGDERTAVPTCEEPGASQAAIDIVNSYDRKFDEPPSTPIFIRPTPNQVNLYPNPDNVYVATLLAHEPGRIAVIRGRAPTFPDTRAGDPITGDEQVRFWSMCTNEARQRYPVTACASDDEVALDADGWYTFVIATAEDRPEETTATEGATIIDWGSTDVAVVLLLRNMVANPSFHEATDAVEPGALTGSMGDYSPTGAYCDVETFEQGGYQACGL